MQLLPFHYCSIKTRNGTCRRSLYNCKDNGNVEGSVIEGGQRYAIHYSNCLAEFLFI